MQNPLAVLVKSVSQPSYYKDVLTAKLSFSIKYYIFLGLVLTGLGTAAATYKTGPVVEDLLGSMSKELLQNYPKDLTIDITPEGVKTNMPSRFVLKAPQKLKAEWENLLIIDPQGEVGLLAEYKAPVLINNSYVVVADGGTVQTTPLADLPEIYIDYQRVQSLADTFRFGKETAYILTGLAALLQNAFDYFVLQLVYLLIFAFVVYAVFKRVTLSYTKSLQISLHTVTLPLIIGEIMEIVSISAAMPGWFILVHAFITLYTLNRLENTA
ncbi:TPA: hypothetical protein DCY43_00630 [candidate division WWE3 bacterium]|uniref:DUF1189 domain-containing protein n=4 Tax=Katanobacteria TaxID=422282 RepID=A0A0G1MQK0_UNCKA|nr:MAG: hypothetical protein UT20_C0053G0007 [Candidatus Levybacteria bacterium GW2011_GWA1_39_11]KKT45301.1 MAG: hypothetical protein UW36_C0008G0002 [candidate division WWE3 bacterium GW2011_GWA2_44_16]KKT83077.1 MAG: hypothetical protein UW82_C0048G0011 [candidate division WWE3 bacterium GW2011_GWC2_44_9]OGC51821.1 MAG: hypothetical protein A2709_01430 [candidate division WWE3 bacterium RIFCSPHIGHO2_01_FULL_43_9]HAZ29247.1 hypothetical protein [candidate division WWE3 bacterium]